MIPTLIVDGMPAYRVNLGPDPMAPLLNRLFNKETHMPVTPQIPALPGMTPLGFHRTESKVNAVRKCSASILLPLAYSRSKLIRGLSDVAEAFPGIEVEVKSGATDAPCVDTVPMGGESVISGILEKAQG